MRRRLAPLSLLIVAACGGSGPDDEAEAQRPAPLEGAVSATTAEAAAAGVEILEAGGNAVDAAVAVSFALGVTEPAESGPGGAVTMLIVPPDGPAVVLAPPRDRAVAVTDDATGEEPTGYGLVAVPTAVRILEAAWREYGSGRIAWEDLLAPAIRLARGGYPLGRFRHRILVREYERIRADSAGAALLLGEGGTIPTERATLSNPALARTLRRLAQEGPEDFYRGRIAQTLVEEVREGGGSMTLQELAGLGAPSVAEPLEGRYRDWEVLTVPSPRGEAFLSALRLLERAPPDTLAAPGAARTQWIAEALRFAALPLLPDTARPEGTAPGGADAYLASRPPITGAPVAGRAGGQRRTTHFSVADERGMVVAVGQSLGGPYGAGILSPDLGFFLNRHARPAGGALGAGGEPLPGVDALGAVLRHEGGDLVGLGSPGGWRGVEAAVQVVSAVVDGQRPLRDAVAVRRVHWGPAAGAGELLLEGTSWSVSVPELGLGPPGATRSRVPSSPFPDSVRDTLGATPAGGRTSDPGPRAAGPGLRAEAHALFGDSVAPLLRGRGFRLGELETGLTFEGRDPYFGRVQAVARIGGVWEAAADPRSDGEGRVLTGDAIGTARVGSGARR